MLLPGQLIGQDGQALIVSTAARVVFHQSHRVQQPHVATGLPAEVAGRVKGAVEGVSKQYGEPMKVRCHENSFV